MGHSETLDADMQFDLRCSGFAFGIISELAFDCALFAEDSCVHAPSGPFVAATGSCLAEICSD